jgi:hypothetical protein
MRFFFVVLFLCGFVSSLDVEFDCPHEVEIDEKFKCSIDIEDGYDVKVDISKDDKSVARIFDEEGNWKSAYYYLKDFSREEVLLKITEEGEYEGDLKVRRGEVVETFGFEIDAFEGEIEEDVDLEVESEETFMLETFEIESSKGIISLNSHDVARKEVLVYESREVRNFRLLPYMFSLFLIGIVIVLLWEKF